MDLIERGSSMRLASAEISRFKSIQHAFVALGKSFNCICGPNGVGKSNLTQAICFALTLPPHVIQPDADHHVSSWYRCCSVRNDQLCVFHHAHHGSLENFVRFTQANTGNKWNFIFPDQATDLGEESIEWFEQDDMWLMFSACDL